MLVISYYSVVVYISHDPESDTITKHFFHPVKNYNDNRPIPRGGSRRFVRTPLLMGRILFSV